jgi:excisionase family DNA binding protein
MSEQDALSVPLGGGKKHRQSFDLYEAFPTAIWRGAPEDIGIMNDRDHYESGTSPPLQGTVSVAEILHYVADDRYLSLDEACRYLSLSKRTIRSHLLEIKYYRFGERKLLFKKSDLDRWMERYLETRAELDLDRIADEVVEGVLGVGK